MPRKSRYENTKSFAPDPRGNSNFTGVRPRDLTSAKGVIEHNVSSGERLDRLSENYFDDTRLWWRLADANRQFLFGPDMLHTVEGSSPGDDDPLQRHDMVGRPVLVPKARE